MNQTTGYANPHLLAEPQWLSGRQDDPSVRVIDCGKEEAYARAHIPGAVHLGAHPWLKEPEDGLHVMSGDAFAELMSKLGVSQGTTVIAYDDFNTTLATRVWWVLRYYGHTAAKVLNGGWARWMAEQRPVMQNVPQPPPGRFVAKRDDSVICLFDRIRANYDDPGVQILNVLPTAHYRGKSNPFGNARTGHIPGSRNVPIEEFIASNPAVFKPADELRAILDRAGLSPERETIVHCQAGVRTTMGFFVLTLLGWSRVRAYDAAMAEWANRQDTPLTT